MAKKKNPSPPRKRKKNPDEITERQIKHALADRLSVEELSETIGRKSKRGQPPPDAAS